MSKPTPKQLDALLSVMPKATGLSQQHLIALGSVTVFWEKLDLNLKMLAHMLTGIEQNLVHLAMGSGNAQPKVAFFRAVIAKRIKDKVMADFLTSCAKEFQDAADWRGDFVHSIPVLGADGAALRLGKSRDMLATSRHPDELMLLLEKTVLLNKKLFDAMLHFTTAQEPFPTHSKYPPIISVPGRTRDKERK